MTNYDAKLFAILILSVFSLTTLQVADSLAQKAPSHSSRVLGTTTILPQPGICEAIGNLSQRYCLPTLPSPSVMPTSTTCNKTVFCDVNKDGQINAADLAIITNCWHQPVTGVCAQFNYDCNNTLDVADLQKYTYTCPQAGNKPNPSPSPVPTAYPTRTTGNIIPGKIEAEQYSAISNAAKQTTSDIGGGQALAYITQGAAFDYQVYVNIPGKYQLQYRVASPYTGAGLSFIDYTTHAINTTPIPKTGGWQTWTTINGPVVYLNGGSQTLHFNVQNNTGNTYALNFNWFQANLLSTNSPTPTAAP